MSTKGQTINDRINAAKYTLAGRALSRCICKATTEEMMKPKKKHLDYLAACTFESDISMQELASQLIERTSHSNWVVVYKALITIHHLMSFGNERFTQYLASSNYSIQPSGFQTRGYSISAFIRRYAVYINQKALSYRTLAVDLCRKQRTKEKILRSMPMERLLETLPVVQKQLDTLLDFGCTANDLNNSIITSCFTLLFHDAIRLFASYNDGIINLFEKYFDLNKKMCREAFEAYKRFLTCSDRVADFLKIAEAINLDRGEVPDLRKAPSSLLEALEEHLINLESNRKRERSAAIDTSSAALPSFSTNLEFEPSMSMAAKGLDIKIDRLASSDSVPEKAIEAIQLNENNIVNDRIDQSNVLTLSENSSKPIQDIKTVEFSDDFGEDFIQDDITKQEINLRVQSPSIPAPKAIDDLKNTDIFGPSPIVHKEIENIQVVEFKPPGYSDGSLLKPECTVQACFDPSIDPQTQQQLIKIQMEQAVFRQKQGSATSQNLNISGKHDVGQAIRPSTTKPKPESIFEDLEKTMRQSLMKVEKA